MKASYDEVRKCERKIRQIDPVFFSKKKNLKEMVEKMKVTYIRCSVSADY